MRHVYSLLMRVWELDQQRHYLTKTEAYELVALRHGNARQRNVELAVADGFLIFKPSATDARKWLVKPGVRLQMFVETEMQKSLVNMYETLKKIHTLNQKRR